MKRLLLGTAALTVAVVALNATPASAQSYTAADNVKSHDSTLSAATYAKPQPTQVPVQMPPPAPAPVAQAAPPPAPEPVNPPRVVEFSGPYVGAEGQYNHGTTHGFGGGGVIGFGWVPDADTGWLSHAYLGAEAGFDWSGAHGDNQTVAEHKKFNISIRPGVTVDHLLAYGIAGYTDADYKSNVTNDNNWLNGYMLGAGVQAALPHTPFKTRFEYVYSNYQRNSASEIGRPHDNDFKVGLIYQIPVKKGGMW